MRGQAAAHLLTRGTRLLGWPHQYCVQRPATSGRLLEYNSRVTGVE